MKYIFYTALLALAVFEFLNVYFIMPMPGSQPLDAVNLAYFLHQNRWIIRAICTVLFLMSALKTWTTSNRWIMAVTIVVTSVVIWVTNFRLAADHMFLQPETVRFGGRPEQFATDSTLLLAAVVNGEAKAWPIRYIAYHHHVRDTIAGRPILATYCTVCRTGRVFEPLVNGKPEKFRLVGMSKFNAMLEDETTGSWWRQANGEAIAGSLTGSLLPEIESFQVTASEFFGLYPNGQVMLADPKFTERYDTLGKYERGLSTSHLTRRDSLSWQDKSWVVGVVAGKASKAYDWNYFVTTRIIRDRIGKQPILLVLSLDKKSFRAFGLASDTLHSVIAVDTLNVGGKLFGKDGRPIGHEGPGLITLPAYQEYWHSWRTFHPETGRYPEAGK